MKLLACIPVIPSTDLEKSLQFWVGGLGLTRDMEMKREGKLIGCMVHNEHLYFWLNEREGTPNQPETYEGIRCYWTPGNIYETRSRLRRMGLNVSEMEVRDYGQTEFFVTDYDGYTHCFGVDTKTLHAY